MKVQVVHPDHLQSVWNDVSEFIDRALIHAPGEDTLEQVKVYLSMGSLQLIVFVDDDGFIQGAATVKYINQANRRIGFVSTIGGRLITGPYALQQFLQILRDHGADTLEGSGKDSIVRLWQTKLGAKKKYSVVEVKL